LPRVGVCETESHQASWGRRIRAGAFFASPAALPTRHTNSLAPAPEASVPTRTERENLAHAPDLIGFLIAIKRVLPGRVQVRITGFGEETHEQIPTAVASSQASASVGDVDISLAPVFNIDVSKVVHPQEQTGRGRAEAPEESHPAPEATDGTKGRPLESEESDDPVDRLPNRVRRAYAQYLLAAEQYEGNAGGPPTDRQLHAWLKRHSEERLPAFETWARYLRDARQALGTQKNSPLAGREHGRSVVSCHDVEPLRRHEAD